jgi:hypothetical protein
MAGVESTERVQGLLVGLAVLALMLVGVVPAQALPRVTVLHVFVAAGLSGRGLASGTTDMPEDKRTFRL